MSRILLILTISFLFSCTSKKAPFIYDKTLKENEAFHSDGFVFPIGKNGIEGYYNAQKFRENDHLGEDWNGKGGGNTDLGDPIYAASHGYVFFAGNLGGGWGNVVRVIHYLPNHPEYEFIETVYAHCDEILVNHGELVKRGQKIGTIGNNEGMYNAHLHFELRTRVGRALGGGYSEDASGFLDPTKFIKSNRP